MRRLSLILLFIASCFYANAQEILSPQPEAKYITSFPFSQFSGGVMVIRACFDNIRDSLNFILDTGSGGISLDSSTCEEFSIQTHQTDTSITGIAGIRKVHFVFDKTLHLPGLDVHNLNFHVIDYEVLSSVYGQKVDGIIGYSFFSRYIVKINFDSQRVQIYSPGKMRYPDRGALLHPIFTSLPIQYLQVKDRKKMPFNFYIDTGAGLCLLMSEQFVKDSSIILSRRKPLVTQAEGMGGMLKMRLTVVKELKVGPFRFHQVPTYLYQDDNNVTAYPFTGGLLGNDILRRFNIIMNYPQREIHITPNSRFDEPFDYAYTGLGLYYVNGKNIIADVIKDSPAEKAGLKPEDEVIAVGTDFSGNIQAYRNALQSANEKIKILVKRGKDLFEVTIKPRSIL